MTSVIFAVHTFKGVISKCLPHTLLVVLLLGRYRLELFLLDICRKRFAALCFDLNQLIIFICYVNDADNNT